MRMMQAHARGALNRREKFFDIPDCRKDEISIFVLMMFTKAHRQMRIVFDGPQDENSFRRPSEH